MPLPCKLLLIMKLTTFILILSLAQLSARTFGQRVTLSENSSPIEKVLKNISEQTGYNFIYSDADLKNKKVSIEIVDLQLTTALDKITQGLNLDYKVTGNNIAITRKPEPTILQKIIEKIKAINVSGTVLDENGRPLSGASVRLKSTGRGVSTDLKGNFILPDVQNSDILVISYLGYKSVEIPPRESLGNIQLQLADSKLDEVQVVAYNKTSLRQSTGNITSISAADIEKSPVNNPILALQGRVPGMTIVQATGNANSGISVLIQGKSSLRNQTNPFYVLDGVPFPSTSVDIYSLPSANAGGSPLSFINPDDIESVTVLKDADATAIYGSRAANGAVLITTKKGKSGALQTTFDLQQGIGQVAKKLKMMDTQEYLAMRREAKKNDNANILAGDYDLNGTWDPNAYTDWQEELIGKNASYSNYNLSFSGGSDNTTFLVSSAYKRSTTVSPGELSDQSLMAHLNLNTKSKDQRFSLQLKTDYTYNQNNLLIDNLTTSAVTLPPNAPALYNADGTLNWAMTPTGVASWKNPLALLVRTYSGKTRNLSASTQMDYKFTKDLTLSASLGYNDLQTDAVRKYPLEFYAPNQRASRVAFANYNNTGLRSWIAEPQLNYKKSTGYGDFHILLGGSVQQQKSFGRAFEASNFLSNATMDDPASAATIAPAGTVDLPYKYLGVFGALNYNYKGRYLVNVGGRRDGSSRFGENNKFHNFASLGLGWAFSQEEWFNKENGILSFGKIRASYGTTGNDQLPDYSYLSLYYSFPVDLAYGNLPALQAYTLGNPYIQWEETRKLNLGIDLGLIKDRILLNLNYYRNRSSNMLIAYALPSFVGFSSVPSNFPATVQNSGLEVSITSENLKTSAFRWSTSLNFTLPRNKLIRYDGLETSEDKNTYKVGEPISVFRAYNYAGINPQTGRYQFRAANGTLTSTPAPVTDQTEYINMGQRFNGGLENSFAYKGLTLSFLFQFVRQNGPNLGFGPTTVVTGIANTAAITDVLDRWRSPSEPGTFQRYGSTNALIASSAAYLGSNAVVRDASYIRLKNLSLAWSLPQRWQQTLHARSLKIYGEGQNLLTFTRYRGLDPESLNSTTLPPLRVMTLGLRAAF